MSTDNELTASAAPIVASTITLETIQDVLHTEGYGIECKTNLLFLSVKNNSPFMSLRF